MQLPDVGIDKNPFRGGSNQRACIALAAILMRDANIYFRFVVESAIEADLSQWDTVVLCNEDDEIFVRKLCLKQAIMILPADCIAFECSGAYACLIISFTQQLAI